MELITWKDEFSVNVRAIDEQHKKLLGMINELHAAMIQRKGQEILSQIVDRMLAYASTHFAAEERYMVQFHYLGYLAHKEEHEKFIGKAKDLQQRLNDRTLVLSLEVVTFLKDWLTNHIVGIDKRYGPHFNSHGLQ
jgi:hemerythrin